MIFSGILNGLTLICVVLYCFPTVDSSQSIKYKRLTENAQFPLFLELFEQTSVSECSVHCDRETECISFNYNHVNHRCELTDHYPQIVADLTESSDPIPEEVHLQMDSIVDWSIYYRDNPSCIYDYTVFFASEQIQTKTSTNYPNPYNNNENYYWLFVKPATTSTLYLDFIVMDLEPDAGCPFDSVTVYSGACTDAPILAKLCGNTRDTVIDTSGVYVLLNFRSDPWTTRNGFYMNYYID